MIDSRTWIKRVVYALVGLFALWVFGNLAFGQTLSGEAHAEMSVWAQHDRCYQHSMSAEGRGKVSASPFFVEGFLRVKWWGVCDAKIPSSFLNAEAGKVIERWHGVNVGLEHKGLQLGATVRRDAVHHIWRHRDRHPWFPGGWQVGRRGCNGKKTPGYPAGEGCPSIGYYDGVGPFVGYEGHGVDAELTGPQYRWKSLTLPWPDWTLSAEYRRGSWHAELYGQAGGPAYPALSGELLYKIPAFTSQRDVRKLTRNLWVGVRGGRVDAPGWRKPLDRIAITLQIQ